jgi:uncharacterized protein YukE
MTDSARLLDELDELAASLGMSGQDEHPGADLLADLRELEDEFEGLGPSSPVLTERKQALEKLADTLEQASQAVAALRGLPGADRERRQELLRLRIEQLEDLQRRLANLSERIEQRLQQCRRELDALGP